ncbi:heparin-binding hemagglutinin [Nocardia stercoris]|uniref:heparin-binding hemagglutinin n=1 Tax=Nocardia stercoris TaxID=2483361 RepID=UPI001319DD99|nr:heparin-binding hemagglutinin [Nocardia stercoris]
MTETITTVTKPLYATVGAGDAIFTAVTEAVEKVRDSVSGVDVSGRVEEARERIANLPADVQEQLGALRERVSTLPTELPEEVAALRDKLNSEELRKLVDQLLDLYSDLAVRGEETVGKLRANPVVEGRLGQAENLYNDVVHRAEGVYDSVSTQVSGLLGKAEAESEAEPVVDAEVVQVTTEVEAAPEPKPAPAKKAPAKKAPAKKAAAAKKQ